MMGELKTRARAFWVDYQCDVCSEGVMQPTNAVCHTDLPLFVHKCSYCGMEMNFREKYPKVTYEKVIHEESYYG